jgi:hypothetical protein
MVSSEAGVVIEDLCAAVWSQKRKKRKKERENMAEIVRKTLTTAADKVAVRYKSENGREVLDRSGLFHGQREEW